MTKNSKILALAVPLCLLVATAANTRLDPARQIKWPTGAAGCVYAPATNTCVTAAGGSGTVTSAALTMPSWLTVTGSPITTSGTFGVTATGGQTANWFLATPNGSAGAVALRAILAADVPLLNQNTSGTAGGLTGNPNVSVTNLTVLGTCTGCGAGGSGVTSIDTQTGAFTFGGAGVSHVGNAYTFTGAGSGVTSINSTSGAFTFTGAGVSCTSTTCTFTGTGSGVSSVALTAPSWLTVTGSPVTSSGTLALSPTSEAANLFLASPNGSSGAMAPRAIVAADVPLLTSAQIPAQYKIKPCTVGMGDGVNPIPAATYPVSFQCFNDYGVTYTITGFQCASDNSGTSKGNASDSAGNPLLTGAITATPTWAPGTQSGTTTLVNGAWVNWSIVADGTSKQITCRMKGTY